MIFYASIYINFNMGQTALISSGSVKRQVVTYWGHNKAGNIVGW